MRNEKSNLYGIVKSYNVQYCVKCSAYVCAWLVEKGLRLKRAFKLNCLTKKRLTQTNKGRGLLLLPKL